MNSAHVQWSFVLWTLCLSVAAGLGGSVMTSPVLASGLNTNLTRAVKVRPVTLSTRLVVGQIRKFSVSTTSQRTTLGQLVWTTDIPRIVSVSQTGAVTALSVGSATVRAALVSNPAVFIDFPVTVDPVSVPTLPTVITEAYAQQVLSLTNKARRTAHTCGLLKFPAAAPLTLNWHLSVAAQAHVSDMATRNYFSHTSLDGRSFSQRVTEAGYAWSTVGENIAAGQATPEAVVAGWVASPDHCINVMNASFTQLGVGYVQGGSYGSVWAQDFGRPR